ncbi:phage tail protein [Azospirillum cavernae]|uniref:Phage tail protein n=1 Tax=Azospirillum cavernae TaxID=2320860 RepID=A0A418W0S2_9PROT|nr:tail fiber protein [Azospirillum cavernae]RJF83626.1 phage tail protein [Azospirillum cavernae]
MSDWFLGEIRLFPMNWAPQDWHVCDGTVMQIQQNQALYSLIGTTYGGDGKNTFQLPDLRGRVPVDQNYNDTSGEYVRGKAMGVETVALTAAQTPQHQHTLNVLSTAGATANSVGSSISGTATSPIVLVAPNLFASPGPAPIPLNPAVLSTTGDGAAHNNMQPFLVLNFCIATSGIYPPRN